MSKPRRAPLLAEVATGSKNDIHTVEKVMISGGGVLIQALSTKRLNNTPHLSYVVKIFALARERR